MYLGVVLLTMLVLPAGSIAVELTQKDAPFWLLVGRWFVFWAVGVRLGIAGIRQISRPAFTAREIFDLSGHGAETLVIELGTANVGMGIIGIASLFVPSFVLPAAISAGLFYAVAGVRHAQAANRGRNENIAMISDLLAAIVLGAFLAVTYWPQ